MRKRSFTTFSIFIFSLVLMTGLAQAKERCVVDDSGRQVCVPNTPLKIISLAPGSTELLFAAGAGQQVVAVDQYSDYPPETKNLPNVGGYPNINVEAIISYQPDLVVVWTGGNSQKVIRQLEKLDLKTFHINAQDFAGIDRNIRQLGQIAGTEISANKAADQFNQRLKQLKDQYQQQSELTVFFEIWRDPLMTVGGSQVITNAIQVCGGRSLYAEIPQPTVKVGMEQLIASNPDVIIGSDPRGSTSQTQKDMLDYWQRWKGLSAVKHRHMFSVPSDAIARLTPRILDGTEIICEELHAVRVKKVRIEAEPKTARISNH